MAVHLRGKGIDLEKILKPSDARMRRTKIVCTIGPSCWDVERLVELIDAGMNVARLNFSHGDHERHAESVRAVRAAVAARPGCHVAIMLDTKGPEIRTGLLKDHKAVSFVAGQDLVITTDYTFEGDATKIACSYKTLPTSVKVGSTILIADGSVVAQVKEILADGVLVTVLNSATIGEKKNMNLPGVVVDLPTITDKDTDDLVNFGLRYGVDMIAASFVRKASDITTIREVLGPAGRAIKIIAKIENQEGLHNYDDIVKAADGIMVARGDLGMEIPIEKVFMAQKMMIRKANLLGKPVITATQMLESMISNPRPTRAECSDVANAVLDGSDAVMLSGETANGSHPIEAVHFMARTCVEAESITNYSQLFAALRESTLTELGTMSIPEAIASSAVKTQIDMGAKVIIVCSETGNSARLVAKYRPGCPILALTATDSVARQVNGLNRGALSVVMGSMIGTESILLRACEIAKDAGWASSGDYVVAVHGTIEGRPGSTNMLKVLTVP